MMYRRQRAGNTRNPFLYPLLALAVLGVAWCVLMLYLSAYPPGRWRFIAVPPVPPEATQVEIGYPSNDVERITEFVTAQSADEISAFYRAELPAKGWSFQCQLPGDAPCGRWSAPIEGGVVELYRQPGRTGGGPTLAIFITPPGFSSAAGNGRVVTLRECCLQQYP